MSRPDRWTFFGVVVMSAALLVNGCGSSSDTGTGSGTFTLTSSSILTVVTGRVGNFAVPTGGGGGGSTGVDASSLKVGVYAAWLASAADCSSPVLVKDYGSAQVKDFVAGPTLLAGSPPSGAYNCLAVKVSDILTFTPATDASPCSNSTTYTRDTYQVGTSAFLDVNLQTITPHGSSAGPSEDALTYIFTTNPSAAEAKGFNAAQVIALSNPIVLPTTGTLVLNGSGTVVTENFLCSIEPGAYSFR